MPSPSSSFSLFGFVHLPPFYSPLSNTHRLSSLLWELEKTKLGLFPHSHRQGNTAKMLSAPRAASALGGGCQSNWVCYASAEHGEKERAYWGQSAVSPIGPARGPRTAFTSTHKDKEKSSALKFSQRKRKREWGRADGWMERRAEKEHRRLFARFKLIEESLMLRSLRQRQKWHYKALCGLRPLDLGSKKWEWLIWGAESDTLNYFLFFEKGWLCTHEFFQQSLSAFYNWIVHQLLRAWL